MFDNLHGERQKSKNLGIYIQNNTENLRKYTCSRKYKIRATHDHTGQIFLQKT